MDTFSYICFQLALLISPFFVFFIYVYIIYKIYKNKDLWKKVLLFILFLLLANIPIGKLPLTYLKMDENIYVFQTCDATFTTRNIDNESRKWKDKKAINNEFQQWKEKNPEQKDAILYRAFEFHWWEFWEYYRYATSSVYQYPLLPTDCAFKPAYYYGKDGHKIY